MSDSKLINKYREMSALTEPICKSTCMRPYSCCHKSACDMALQWAREKWDLNVRHLYDASAKVPFLGEAGCRLTPHLRPMCTVFTCKVHAVAVFDSEDTRANDDYWKLREEIDILEWAKYDETHP